MADEYITEKTRMSAEENLGQYDWKHKPWVEEEC
jgi:hypothetical protein